MKSPLLITEIGDLLRVVETEVTNSTLQGGARLVREFRTELRAVYAEGGSTEFWIPSTTLYPHFYLYESCWEQDLDWTLYHCIKTQARYTRGRFIDVFDSYPQDVELSAYFKMILDQYAVGGQFHYKTSSEGGIQGNLLLPPASETRSYQQSYVVGPKCFKTRERPVEDTDKVR
jgi:hypothetical protein